nr:hypothetical protein HmN_000340200 [Hymenolepis microstoma]
MAGKSGFGGPTPLISVPISVDLYPKGIRTKSVKHKTPNSTVGKELKWLLDNRGKQLPSMDKKMETVDIFMTLCMQLRHERKDVAINGLNGIAAISGVHTNLESFDRGSGVDEFIDSPLFYNRLVSSAIMSSPAFPSNRLQPL